MAGRQGEWFTDFGVQQPQSQSSPSGGSFHFRIQPFTTQREGKTVGMSVSGKTHSIPPANNDLILQAFYISVCFHCDQPSVWHQQGLLYPTLGGLQPPSPDLLPEIQDDYIEAAGIANRSPRGAAALLRLCIQKLCIQLGLPGKNINDDIAALVKKGLPSKIQQEQALDVVRVAGNNAVHPGNLDMKDDIKTANKLFALVNLIAEVMISQPKHVEEMFNSLVPEGAKDAIAKERARNNLSNL